MKIFSAIIEWYSKNKTRDGELESWIIAMLTFAILFAYITTNPIIDAAYGLHPTANIGNIGVFPQITRVVLVFGIGLVFLVFPICMCFRPLSEKRKLIAISIVALLSISVLLVRFLRLRFLGV